MESADEQSVANQPKRKRARLSCNTCRIKRRKCDGSPPDKCSGCEASGVPCSWATERKRGPPPSKVISHQKEKLERHILLLWKLVPELWKLSEDILRNPGRDPANISLPDGLQSARKTCDELQNNIDIDPGRYRETIESIYGKEEDQSDFDLSPGPITQSTTASVRAKAGSGSMPAILPVSVSSPRHRIQDDDQLKQLLDNYSWEQMLSGQMPAPLPSTSALIQSSETSQSMQPHVSPFQTLHATTGNGSAVPIPNPSFTGTSAKSGSSTAQIHVQHPPWQPQGGSSSQRPHIKQPSAPQPQNSSMDAREWHDDNTPSFHYGRTSGMYKVERAARNHQALQSTPTSHQSLLEPNLEARSTVVDIYLTYMHTYFPMLNRMQLLRWSSLQIDMRPGLVCAVMALATPYVPSLGELAHNSQTWEALSLRDLEATWTEPHLERVQALILLTLLAWSQGSQAKARGRLAQATAAAFDVGLHSLHTQTSDVPALDLQSAYRTWHSLTIVDTLLSCHLGRPALIQSHYQVPLPSDDGSAEWEPWKPEPANYLLANYQVAGLKVASLSRVLPAKSLSSFRQLATLCQEARQSILAGEARSVNLADESSFNPRAINYACEQAIQNPSLSQHALDVYCIQAYFGLVAQREGFLTFSQAELGILPGAVALLRKRLSSYTYLRSPISSMLLADAVALEFVSPSTTHTTLDDHLEVVQIGIAQFKAIFTGALLPLTTSHASLAAVASRLESTADGLSALGQVSHNLPNQLALGMQTDRRHPPASLPQVSDFGQNTFSLLAGQEVVSNEQENLDSRVNNPDEEILPTPTSHTNLNMQTWLETDVLASLGFLTTPAASQEENVSLATMIEAWNQGASYQGTI